MTAFSHSNLYHIQYLDLNAICFYSQTLGGGEVRFRCSSAEICPLISREDLQQKESYYNISSLVVSSGRDQAL